MEINEITQNISLQLCTGPYKDTARQNLQYLQDECIVYLSIENAMETYIQSKFNKNSELLKQCRNYLIRKMCISNVCRIHDFACDQNDTLIQYYCWKVFESASTIIFNGNDFLHCRKTTIDRYVSRPIYPDSLTEIRLFKAIYNWALVNIVYDERSNFCLPPEEILAERCRHVLEPFINKIRFLSMSKIELESVVFPLNILKHDEIYDICFYFYDILLVFLSNISTISNTRSKIFYSELFRYKNRESLREDHARTFDNRNHFE
ncbi:uncharacterized protein LOC111620208 [Centruroides sculpturatus]|uniref:uncharacterized protein LOC111620208 n=1 Tax=Centruroides sculpturatus TaxID=218467 RepID=UPI000C6D4F53|nr:uncharacterized protein LOC111620208 [Centruroides sculpturatus]